MLERFEAIRPYSYQVAFGIVVVAITYLSLIFGELVPQRLALARPEPIAEIVAYPVMWCREGRRAARVGAAGFDGSA